MTDNTVIAVFDRYSDAERAVTELERAGIARSSIEITSNDKSMATVGTTHTSSTHDDDSIGERIGNFFSRLFGGEDNDDANYYSDALTRGRAVVSVDARNEEEADRAAELLQRNGAIDIDEGTQSTASGLTGSAATSSGLTGSRSTTNLDAGREQVIPVVREELQVGKRRRDRGGVRIYTHTTERNAEEQVRLREEHARVERRPADRPATEADLAAFKEGTIEIRESIEEPVVGKTARVVEEVVVGKETTERVETVNGTLRNREVDVEQLDSGTQRTTGTTRGAASFDDYDSDYRTHWQSNYASTGGTYDQYQPAYRYGSSLRNDPRYRDRDWSAVESDARRDWETRNPGSTWERFKAAIRHGWDKVTP